MKFLKYTFFGLLFLTIAGFITFWILDEPLPKGEMGKNAEQLADKMLLAINDEAWDKTAVVEWNYQNIHTFIWDKKRNYTKVSWDKYEAFVDLHLKEGVVFKKGKQVTDSSSKAELIQKAYSFWVNDSFWLNPISKIRDKGTIRAFVEREENNGQGLLVTYNNGGLTPGDSYLWIVDTDTYRPKSVKMWVSIIPIGGVEFSWEEYAKTETGAIISTYHQGPLNIHIYDLKTYDSINDLEDGDIFSML